jgi:hypothetical protein
VVLHLVEGKLIKNNILLVIPSWGSLLGYPTLGKYNNNKVSKIFQDLVIFLGGSECAISTESGTLYFLFGLGYYYVKFELQSGIQITDRRQLTGLVLPDFVYDHLATSKNIALETDRDIIVSENLFKLPIDMSFKSDNKIAFIQGALMRNLFIPYKNVFLEFIKTIREPTSYKKDTNKHMILSSFLNYFNEILISRDMEYETKRAYMNNTAGLNDISFGVDKFLKAFFTTLELHSIDKTILKLKSIYSSIEYDPMFLFSIFEKSSSLLKDSKPFSFNLEDDRTYKKMPKESILISAEKRMNSFKDWPLLFKRQTKEQLYSIVNEQVNIKEKKKTLEKPTVPEFELRTKVNPVFESKPLPLIQHNDISQILLTLKKIVKEDYEKLAIGEAFEIGRNHIKKQVLYMNYLSKMSKYVNLYQKSKPNIGLSPKEKTELLKDIDNWIKITHERNNNL